MTAPKYYWDDMDVGFTARTGGKTVTKDEIVEFASVYDPQPFHLDEEAAKDSILGGLCASGWHSCAIAMRLVVDDIYPEMAPLGSPGIEEVRWRRPLYAGETVKVELKVTERRASQKRPDMGLTRFFWTMTNEEGDIIMTCDCWVMFARRPDAQEEKGAA